MKHRSYPTIVIYLVVLKDFYLWSMHFYVGSGKRYGCRWYIITFCWQVFRYVEIDP